MRVDSVAFFHEPTGRAVLRLHSALRGPVRIAVALRHHALEPALAHALATPPSLVATATSITNNG
jgi:hypothetical protein